MSEQPTLRAIGGRRVHDLVGIGIGPANLALGVALEEEAERPGGIALDRLFLEARSEQCWHPDMLIEGSLIQITVLKDLVTVRDPRSRFTFLNYLKEKGRLYEFLNLRDLFPSRVEFNDYLCWVAGQLAANARYGRAVKTVRPLTEPNGTVRVLEVVAEDRATGGEESYLTQNVVVATGGRPTVPAGIELPEGEDADRVFHSHEFKTRIARGFPDRQAPYRFVVVGSGQSAAELFYCLLQRYPNADVTATVRGHGYKPVDESDFTNEVFFPHWVDFFYDLPEDKQTTIVDSFRDVNYAVVDHALIRKIYRFLYDERVAGRDRGRLRRYLGLRTVETAPGEPVIARYLDLVHDTPVDVECDGLILCSGYRWDKQHPLLEDLGPWLETDALGGWAVRRDYRLAGRPGFSPGVYLQGFCEATHGISETVLSLLPVRAQEIVDSLLAARAASDEPQPVIAGVER